MAELRTCKGFRGRFHDDITYIAGPHVFDCPLCIAIEERENAERKAESLQADLDTERRGNAAPKQVYRMAPEVRA